MKQFFIVFLILFVFLLGGVGFLFSFGEEWSMEVYESKSPTHFGAAVFVAESSIKDTITKLYVCDAGRGYKPWLLGTFDSDNSPMGEIVWSGDGSVVAIRGKIYGKRPQAYGPFFTNAYDFRTHKLINTGKIRPRSRSIRKLIAHRGGQLSAKFSPRKEISLWKWERNRYRPPTIEHESYEHFKN